MESTLSVLLTLGVIIGLFAIGISFSLYLYRHETEGIRHLSRPMPLVDGAFPSHVRYIVRSPRHPRLANKAYSSSRYAWYSLMVIALFLLLAIMAAASSLFGIAH